VSPSASSPACLHDPLFSGYYFLNAPGLAPFVQLPPPSAAPTAIPSTEPTPNPTAYPTPFPTPGKPSPMPTPGPTPSITPFSLITQISATPQALGPCTDARNVQITSAFCCSANMCPSPGTACAATAISLMGWTGTITTGLVNPLTISNSAAATFWHISLQDSGYQKYVNVMVSVSNGVAYATAFFVWYTGCCQSTSTAMDTSFNSRKGSASGGVAATCSAGGYGLSSISGTIKQS